MSASAFGLAIGKALAGQGASAAVRTLRAWARGSEAAQLVRLLKQDHPAAASMLYQPEVIGILWAYAETGELDIPTLVAELRPLTQNVEEAESLAEAVRTTQWRTMRDARQTHFEFLRLRADLRGDIGEAANEILERIEEVISRTTRLLPVARQLPAALDTFVDRQAELTDAAEALSGASHTETARVLCFDGMPGIGKSTLALEVARRTDDRFEGGTLYVDFRAPDGTGRDARDVATRLLRDLGVGPEVISADEGAVTQLRSLLSEIAVLLILDNASNEDDVRALIPANPTSVVLVTSHVSFAGLGQARLATVERLTTEHAVELLMTYVGNRIEAEPAAASAIAMACHGLPLALAVVGARLRRRPRSSLAHLASELERMPLQGLDDPQARIRRSLLMAIDALSPEARRALLLSVAIETVILSADSVSAAASISLREARTVVEELEDRRLLVAGELHQLMREVAVERATAELTPGEMLSAEERRVQWLVDSAQMHLDDLIE